MLLPIKRKHCLWPCTQLPHPIIMGARSPEFMANHIGVLGAEIYPHASMMSKYQDKLSRALLGPPTHKRLL